MLLGGKSLISDLERIFSEVGTREFLWSEVKHLNLENSPQFYHHCGGLRVVRRTKLNINVYKISESFYLKTGLKKKKNLYPERTIF